MWIHEAFATYAESIFLEEHYNYQTAINYLATQRKKIVNKEPIVGPQDVNYNGWKDTDMYYKGTWVLHTLRNAINNDRLWFKMIHDLATEFQLQNVNTNDIIKFINNYTNQNWTSFFEAYLYCNDIPQLDYYIEENTKKKTMYYKWNTCTSLFPLAIPIMLNKQNFTLHPSSSWQSIEITQNIILQINLFAEKFLVKINRTK